MLQRASRLADEGRLDEAADACERVMREHGANAACHCLRGLIHDALSDEERAEESFNKALYLDPNHYEALVHLTLLLERRGDARGASVLRRRAERIPPTSDRTRA